MLLMMAVGALDIITTYVFSRPIPATFEFIETMLVVVAFFAIPLAQSERAHIRVELIYNHMPKFLQFSSDLFGYILNIKKRLVPDFFAPELRFLHPGLTILHPGFFRRKKLHPGFFRDFAPGVARDLECNAV